MVALVSEKYGFHKTLSFIGSYANYQIWLRRRFSGHCFRY